MEKEKLYCSLDIETTGFDPLNDEILEVGFAFFEVTEKGINITEEWSQVFKPSKKVEPKILGLTGITEKELDQAPSFSEHQEFIQNKIGNAVIVGHNVIFDINFLENCGIKFTGGIIDTLDFVQWLLPTRHSYNLENLMHYFQIGHEDAHRALADAKAAILVLEKLLYIFQNLPKSLKEEILEIIKPFNFVWKEMLEVPLKNGDKSQVKEKINKSDILGTNKTLAFSLSKNTILDFPLSEDYIPVIISKLDKEKNKSVFVLPKKHQIMELWKQGKVKAIVSEEDQFNKEKFLNFLKKPEHTPEEIKFLLKVLVWQETNWQTETPNELNLSFFGGQFKQLICGKSLEEDKENKILACDHRTFIELSKKKLYQDRTVVIAGLSEFETTASSNISKKASWGFISYVLKSFYNPATNTGEEKYKQLISELLSATDLFFGLVSALLHTDNLSFQNVKITEELQYSEAYQKIKSAAGNFCEKLEAGNKVLKSESLNDSSENLKNFFEEEENRVKWIELNENRCIFQNSPIKLQGLVVDLFKNFKKIIFIDSLGIKSLFKLFMSRLGLEDFKIENIQQPKESAKKKNVLQPDLFAKILKPKTQKINCTVSGKNLLGTDLLDYLHKDNFPAAIIFSTPGQVREFYEENYQALQKEAFLLTQNHSGGSNKIFRNFGIHKESALLITDKFILKYLSDAVNSAGMQKLPVKTLVISHLPFEQFTHPYLEAVAAEFENSFMDFSLPRAVYNFHKILQFFYTPQLKTLVVADSKLSKEYGKSFLDYLGRLSNIDIKE